MSDEFINYENMLPSERKKILGGRLYDLMNDTAMRKIFISFWEKFAQEDINQVFKMDGVISTDQFDVMLFKDPVQIIGEDLHLFQSREE